MKQINFRQTKYMLPAVMLLPGLIVLFCFCRLFSGGEEDQVVAVARDGLNMELPMAKAKAVDDKFTEMNRKYGGRRYDEWEEPAEVQGVEDVADEETSFPIVEEEEEYEEWDEAEEMKKLEEALARNHRMLAGDDEPTETREEMEARIRREIDEEVQRKLAQRNGQEAVQPQSPATVVAPVEEEKIEIVQKTTSENAVKFNTISSESDESSNPSLIKAMVDQTTKAQDGSRLRFKLLDDVTIGNVDIKKGTYLYGIVSGFSAQRVKVTINSILYNDQFIKVKLSVYDQDGMEGFYVPASAFREFMRDAASQTASSNININQGGMGGLSAEMLAMQALQNIYSSASNAVSSQIRKNKAKIKYSTIVYLINS